MNKEEAYKVLCIQEDTTSTEIDKAYQEKKRETELLLKSAPTAIMKQMGLLELQQIQESRSLIIDDCDSKTVKVSSGRRFIGISLSIICISLLIIEFQLFDKEKILDYWNIHSLKIDSMLASVNFRETFGTSEVMPDSTNTVTVVSHDSKAPNHNLLTTNINKQKTIAEQAAARWYGYRIHNSVPNIPQSAELEDHLEQAHDHFFNGQLSQAEKNYITVTRRYTDLIKKVKPVVAAREKSVAARTRWLNIQKGQSVSEEKRSDLDIHFQEARSREKEGLLLTAKEAYRLATAAYDAASTDSSLSAKQLP